MIKAVFSASLLQSSVSHDLQKSQVSNIKNLSDPNLLNISVSIYICISHIYILCVDENTSLLHILKLYEIVAISSRFNMRFYFIYVHTSHFHICNILHLFMGCFCHRIKNIIVTLYRKKKLRIAGKKSEF